VLAEFIGQVSDSLATFLSANLDFSAEPNLRDLVEAGRIAKSVVVEKNGEKIGIIGATTPQLDVISSPRRVKVGRQVAQEVQTEVEWMEASGVNKIVLISHLQNIEADLELLGQLRGVDVAVAGGGADLLANGCDLLLPGDDQPTGPYPTMVADRDGVLVPVVTTSGSYGYLGKLVVNFDSSGHLTSVDEDGSGPIRIANGDNPFSVRPDCQMQRQVIDQVTRSMDALREPIGSTQVELDGRRSQVRSQETNQGDLMADAVRWQADRVAADYGASRPDVALVNGGGIRSDVIFPAGPVTELDTFDMAPYPNVVTVVEGVSREWFKEALENAVSRATPDDLQEGTGRFGQVSGFSFEWSESGAAQTLHADGSVAVPGRRVQRVVLDDGTVIVGGGRLIDGPPLTVATLDFIARGGDDYNFHGAPFTALGVAYQLALKNYLTFPSGLDGIISADSYPEGGKGRIVRLP
jgi:5'-nucleotidase